MSDRGGVRSSARLSGDGAAAAAAAPARGGGRGRPVSSTAAAALRRARAAERAAEVEDSPRVLRDKCRRLARALRNAKHLVVYTGAGISTAADIPDYRGPHGVWTRLQRGETVGRVEVSQAQPTFTHMALTALWARGVLKFVVSQNCDGLHLRAGLPRRALAELHGDMFAELCAPCRRVYLRAFDTTERTARHQHGTRRLCHACGAELRDSIVHFGERGRAAWPLNWAGALRHAARADVVLCLGSSLKVLRRYPRLWRMQSAPRARPALYIVNLQWTPKDSVAALKINARCDAVMRAVARRLRLRVPRYRAARDPVLAHAEPLAPAEAHTSRRPALLVPPDEPPAADWEPSSPSASDSDEELPLRRLADRLRGPRDSPQPTQSRLTESDAMQHQGEFMRRSQFLNSTNINELRSPDRSDRSPIQSDRNFISIQSDRLLSPTQFDRLHSPNQAERFHSPTHSSRLRRPTPTNRLHSPIQVDRLYSSTRSDRLHSPTEADRLRSPTQADRLRSPTQTDRLHSPLQANRLRSPIQAKRLHSPTQADRLQSPTQTDRLHSPTQSDRLRSPTQTDRLHSPPQADRLRSPTQTDRLYSPTQTDRLHSPTQADRLQSPTQTDRFNCVTQGNGLCTSIKFDKLSTPPQSDWLCTPSKADGSCDQIQCDRLHSPNNCNRLPCPSPPERRRSLSPNCLQNNSNPNRWGGLNTINRQQSVSECDKSNGKLHSFQVSMQAGEATILLRAEHAGGRTAALRRFRMERRAPPAPEPRAPKPEPEPKAEPKDEPKEEASTSDEGAGARAAGSLAAAIIRRAVLLCRASLYPGLHTILAPAAAPAPACAWCARHYAARRCLWYGPAREPAAAARAWRRERGRRYLCACCGAAPDPPPPAPDDGGWYGKGYRKGRRRRR